MFSPLQARAPARNPARTVRAGAVRARSVETRASAAHGRKLSVDRDSASASALGAPLQRKLIIGAANDPLETKADRIADQVMRGDSGVSAVTDAGPARLSRKCAACEEEAATVRMKPAVSATAGSTPEQAPAIVHDVLHASGQPLDAGARAFFEPRFGYDFGGVLVHSEGSAAASARAVQARAYTVGEHVVFGAGEYAPGSQQGRQLLAHELAHVVQQNAPGGEENS